MAYLKWFLLILVNWFASICNWFLAPVVVLFADDSGWLPRWLWWFQTPDNSLDGDIGWQKEHRPFKTESNKLKRWLNRTLWLYRNSMYGFSEDVLGFTIKTSSHYKCIGSENVDNRPIHEGLVRRYLIQNGKTYWQRYYVKSWSSRYCIRANFGWKLWGSKDIGAKKSIVFSFNPFMGYSK